MSPLRLILGKLCRAGREATSGKPGTEPNVAFGRQVLWRPFTAMSAIPAFTVFLLLGVNRVGHLLGGIGCR